MIVDCSTCVVRGHGCAGCVVTVLFGGVPEADLPWRAPGREHAGADRAADDVDAALAALAAAGMLGPEWAPVGLVPTSSPGHQVPGRRAV